MLEVRIHSLYMEIDAKEQKLIEKVNLIEKHLISNEKVDTTLSFKLKKDYKEINSKKVGMLFKNGCKNKLDKEKSFEIAKKKFFKCFL